MPVASASLIIWWKRVFEGDAEIDLAQIPDRKGGKDALATNASIWKEAHEKFREKVKNHQPMEI